MEEKNGSPNKTVNIRVVKKRKRPPKRNCDKNCALCRTPCDNPANPSAVMKRGE